MSEHRKKVHEDVTGGLNLIKAQAMLGVDIDASGLSAEAVALLKASQTKIDAMGSVGIESTSDVRSLSELDVEQQADANLAMAEVFRSEFTRATWSGLDAENITDSSYAERFGYGDEYVAGGTGVAVPLQMGDEFVNVPFSKTDFDNFFAGYTADGGSQDVIERAKGTQAYQLAEEAEASWQARQKAENPETPSAPPEQPTEKSTATDLSALESAVAQNRKDAGLDAPAKPATSTEKVQSRRQAMENTQEKFRPGAKEELEAVRKTKDGQGSPLASMNLNQPPAMDASNRPVPGRQVDDAGIGSPQGFVEASDRYANSVSEALESVSRILLYHSEIISQITQELAEARR